MFNNSISMHDIPEGKTEYFVCVPQLTKFGCDVRDQESGRQVHNMILAGPFEEQEPAILARSFIQESGVDARLVRIDDLD
ncbi:MAG: hypothetical protein OEY97_03815 [Nitrospirota bacterium]|nr:hypothetical protein [Nitrospirota bacterium]